MIRGLRVLKPSLVPLDTPPQRYRPPVLTRAVLRPLRVDLDRYDWLLETIAHKCKKEGLSGSQVLDYMAKFLESKSDQDKQLLAEQMKTEKEDFDLMKFLADLDKVETCNRQVLSRKTFKKLSEMSGHNMTYSQFLNSSLLPTITSPVRTQHSKSDEVLVPGAHSAALGLGSRVGGHPLSAPSAATSVSTLRSRTERSRTERLTTSAVTSRDASYSSILSTVRSALKLTWTTGSIETTSSLSPTLETSQERTSFSVGTSHFAPSTPSLAPLSRPTSSTSDEANPSRQLGGFEESKSSLQSALEKSKVMSTAGSEAVTSILTTDQCPADSTGIPEASASLQGAQSTPGGKHSPLGHSPSGEGEEQGTDLAKEEAKKEGELALAKEGESLEEGEEGELSEEGKDSREKSAKEREFAREWIRLGAKEEFAMAWSKLAMQEKKVVQDRVLQMIVCQPWFPKESKEHLVSVEDVFRVLREWLLTVNVR